MLQYKTTITHKRGEFRLWIEFPFSVRTAPREWQLVHLKEHRFPLVLPLPESFSERIQTAVLGWWPGADGTGGWFPTNSTTMATTAAPWRTPPLVLVEWSAVEVAEAWSIQHPAGSVDAHFEETGWVPVVAANNKVLMFVCWFVCCLICLCLCDLRSGASHFWWLNRNSKFLV